MNALVDGDWIVGLDHTDSSGAFHREETIFRDRINGDEDAKFPVETDRYHLYVSWACSWAHRVIITRSLMGLEESISMDVVDPYREDDGWQFTPEKDGCTADTVNGSDYLRELYLQADPGATCRVTVPVLWDKQTETIVNNESEEIMRMFARECRGLATRDVDLYPIAHRQAIDRTIEELYSSVSNGVYEAGFATSQSAYDEAVSAVFEKLDQLDRRLGRQRYLVGDGPTLADICLFETLVRFDEVHHLHFKCNRRRVVDYDHLWPYLRDLYQTTGFGETVYMGQIKEHYFTTQDHVNPHGIIPIGPKPDFEKPHNRAQLPGEAPSR